MKLSKVIRIDEEKCQKCHRCIAACPVKLCNDGSDSKSIRINDDLCIGCGECIKVCTHHARIAVDDTMQFFTDLNRGEKIVAIVAPAVAANFPKKFLNFNGWLKSLGVDAVFDVSFGAELTVKSYLEAIKESGLKMVIAQPCPAIVTFIQLYQPDLIPYLAPADSPMMHTMRMIREYYPKYAKHRIMVVSPCIAKRREFDEVGIGDYNVTMSSIQKHLEENKIRLDSYPEVDFDNEPAERAVLFSTPGGLMETAVREAPQIRSHIRKIEGPHIIYKYLTELSESVKSGNNPLLIDCLNCHMGCNGGTGTLTFDKNIDIVEKYVEERSDKMREFYRKQGLLPSEKTAAVRVQKAVNRFWKRGLYDRRYANLSSNLTDGIRNPSRMEIQEIYLRMNKFSEADIKNCSSCGYNDCEKMALAIYNKLNIPENCHHYLSNEYEKEHKQKMKMIGDLTEKSQSISDFSKTMVDNLENLTTQLNTQYSEIDKVIGSISEMASFISQSEKIVADKSQIVDVLQRFTDVGVDKVGRTRDLLNEVSKSTHGIEDMLAIMDDITSRTNILALNASIEASHAGASGKGFAVVANEVRKLAEISIDSTKKINKSLQEIIKKMEASIQAGDETGSAFDKINTEVNTVSGTLTEILENIRQISTKSVDILGSIETLSRFGSNVKSYTQELRHSMDSIKQSIGDSLVQ